MTENQLRAKQMLEDFPTDPTQRQAMYWVVKAVAFLLARYATNT